VRIDLDPSSRDLKEGAGARSSRDARTAQGQTRPWGDVGSMSGSPPKAAIQRTSVDVSKVPIPD